MNLRLDQAVLLKLALRRLKLSPQQFVQRSQQMLNWDTLKYITTTTTTSKKVNPKTGLPYFREEQLWETRTHLIKTTQHGRIIDIEEKPRSVLKPQVTIKKSRKINK